MKQFKTLVQVRFTTKKKTLYTICLTTCRTTSAFISQPPKMVKHNQTIRENIGKILKMDGSRTQLVTSLPSKNKTQVLVVKNYAKTDIKFFLPPPVSLYFLTFRSSHTKEFLGKGVLKTCSNFTREHPCRSAISIKLQSNFIEITLLHGCSPANFLLHIFIQNTFS